MQQSDWSECYNHGTILLCPPKQNFLLPPMQCEHIAQSLLLLCRLHARAVNVKVGMSSGQLLGSCQQHSMALALRVFTIVLVAVLCVLVNVLDSDVCICMTKGWCSMKVLTVQKGHCLSCRTLC